MSTTILNPVLTFGPEVRQYGFRQGKVRDIYTFPRDGAVALLATDRVSAFDVVLPNGIPYKGQVLTQLSWYMLEAVKDIVPTWAFDMPHNNIMLGTACEPFKIEMIVRDRLTGSWWRKYKDGERLIAGHSLPDGMKEFDRFSEDGPIITPTTKAEGGEHDEDLSEQEILDRGLCTKDEWEAMCRYSLDLFNKGYLMALERGLLLVDTKYEFGRDSKGRVLLIDEVHTPDSSRYFYADNFEEIVDRGDRPKQLSKEFVREWLMERGFQGRSGDVIPEMTDEFVGEVSRRYIDLYQTMTGQEFVPSSVDEKAISDAITTFFRSRSIPA